MRLPAKVEYAAKAVMELALHYNQGLPIHLSNISRHQKIPKQFLVQLMIRLKSAGLVISSRGVCGGYSLSRPPFQISLADVFKAVDDNILINNKSKATETFISRIWDDINSNIIKRLEETTFDALLSELKKEDLTYCI